jgi:phage portal protein BeeE
MEEVASNFRGYVGGAYMGNGIVFACILSRMQVFSQARFQFQQMRGGRPGDYFGNTDLVPLEVPEPGKTTGDLLARMEADVSLAGNAFAYRDGNRIRRFRPDWMAIALTGEEDDPDAEVMGYVYYPGGPHSGKDPIPYLREEVAHYAPIPDPLAHYRGMSWLTPVIREVMADSGYRDHKINWLEHGGTHNFLFQVDKASMTADQFKDFVSAYRSNYEGGTSAYGSIFLRAAVDATPLGTDMQQSDFKEIQGAGETRIASAAGVPPIVAGFSEGLKSATYSNYGQARRRFADGTVRHLWQNVAASLETIVRPPPGARLWYDDRDIPALQEDLKERAEVQQMQAASMAALVSAGFDTATVIDAVTSGDLKRLVHTGLLSVQLQEPGVEQNGTGNPANVPAVP